AVADVGAGPGNPARPWRRTARAGLYAPHLVHGDPRSDGRDAF
ncbi:carbon-nitrogen hydrolase family protein, partial [Rhizobium sp. TRM95111]|nr:carbon-nitrogen hydrolase family protein [Rhizobium alarense]